MFAIRRPRPRSGIDSLTYQPKDHARQNQAHSRPNGRYHRGGHFTSHINLLAIHRYGESESPRTFLKNECWRPPSWSRLPSGMVALKAARFPQVAPGSLAISFPSTISRSSLGRFSNSMTCPLYSVFHMVLSTQSLPACGETSHHTSLGAVALTAPRSLLRFTFRKRPAACARESATALSWAHSSAFCRTCRAKSIQ